MARAWRGRALAAFPLAYAVMIPALYLPIIVMLIGLILRGVAFEFRFKSCAYRWTWDLAFAGGSIVAALMQGLIIGAFVQGFTVENNQYAGGAFDWLTPLPWSPRSPSSQVMCSSRLGG